MDYNVLLISGTPGSGKSSLIERLKDLLGWEVYGIGQMWRDKWKALYPKEEVSFDDYWKSTSLEDNLEVNRKAREFAKKGNVIFDTRFVNIFEGLPVVSVYITADLDTKAERCLDRYPEESVDEVKKRLKEREETEVKLGLELWNYDYRDEGLYDLVLNSDKLSIDEEVAEIMNFLEAD